MDLSGVYYAPGHPMSGTGEHWFLGDGMVHGIRLSDGKPSTRIVFYKRRTSQNLSDPARGSAICGAARKHAVAHNKKFCVWKKRIGLGRLMRS